MRSAGRRIRRSSADRGVDAQTLAGGRKCADFAESGLSGFGYSAWYGLVFPGGTPQPTIDKMHNALKQVLARDAVKKRLDGVGAIGSLSKPAELRELNGSEIRTYRNVAKKAALEPQ